MKVATRDLQEGMKVDLQGDPYNVCGEGDCRTHGPGGLYDYEYAVVEGTERETADCVRVDFENDSIGFPPDHQVEVEGQAR